MKLKIEIDTDVSSDFGECAAERDDTLAKMLIKLAEKLRRVHDGSGLIRDINGNRVGTWEIK